MREKGCKMKYLPVVLLIALALTVICSTGAMAVGTLVGTISLQNYTTSAATWNETFESYADGALTLANSPWTGGHLTGSGTIVDPRYMYVGAGKGYGGGKGLYNPVHVRCRAYRAVTSTDKVLFFRFKCGPQPPAPPFQREIVVRMTTLDEYESTYETSVTGPEIHAQVNQDATANVLLRFSGLSPITVLTDTWYDVKMTLVNSTAVEYAYKKSVDSTWTTNTGTIPQGFAFNYVNMENVHWYQSDQPVPWIDDIFVGASYGGAQTGTTKVNVEVQMRNPGQTNSQRTVHILIDPANPTYRLVWAPAGTWDFAFKASGWLREVLTNVVINNGQETFGGDVTLLNGDCNGDNTVNTTDRNLVQTNLDTSGDP